MNIHVENVYTDIIKVAKEQFDITLDNISDFRHTDINEVIMFLDYFKRQYDTETDKNARDLNLDCILYLSIFDNGEEMITYRNRE